MFFDCCKKSQVNGTCMSLFFPQAQHKWKWPHLNQSQTPGWGIYIVNKIGFFVWTLREKVAEKLWTCLPRFRSHLSQTILTVFEFRHPLPLHLKFLSMKVRRRYRNQIYWGQIHEHRSSFFIIFAQMTDWFFMHLCIFNVWCILISELRMKVFLGWRMKHVWHLTP